jgi:hypothetical protein
MELSALYIKLVVSSDWTTSVEMSQGEVAALFNKYTDCPMMSKSLYPFSVRHVP